mmetsp:Transcript_13851/g.45287  ORF Transcript_13851/g.45287 Transcript_13851/m.45287 type:complete len:283 (-) Transcript_13851:478-1326(-)
MPLPALVLDQLRRAAKRHAAALALRAAHQARPLGRLNPCLSLALTRDGPSLHSLLGPALALRHVRLARHRTARFRLQLPLGSTVGRALRPRDRQPFLPRLSPVATSRVPKLGRSRVGEPPDGAFERPTHHCRPQGRIHGPDVPRVGGRVAGGGGAEGQRPERPGASAEGGAKLLFQVREHAVVDAAPDGREARQAGREEEGQLCNGRAGSGSGSGGRVELARQGGVRDLNVDDTDESKAEGGIERLRIGAAVAQNLCVCCRGQPRPEDAGHRCDSDVRCVDE